MQKGVEAQRIPDSRELCVQPNRKKGQQRRYGNCNCPTRERKKNIPDVDNSELQIKNGERKVVAFNRPVIQVRDIWIKVSR